MVSWSFAGAARIASKEVENKGRALKAEAFAEASWQVNKHTFLLVSPHCLFLVPVESVDLHARCCERDRERLSCKARLRHLFTYVTSRIM